MGVPKLEAYKSRLWRLFPELEVSMSLQKHNLKIHQMTIYNHTLIHFRPSVPTSRANSSSRPLIQTNFSSLCSESSVGSDHRIQRPFRRPVFFTPLTADRGMINFAFCEISGVKKNALYVNVISPGEELCWHGQAVTHFISNLRVDLSNVYAYYAFPHSLVVAQC